MHCYVCCWYVFVAVWLQSVLHAEHRKNKRALNKKTCIAAPATDLKSVAVTTTTDRQSCLVVVHIALT